MGGANPWRADGVGVREERLCSSTPRVRRGSRRASSPVAPDGDPESDLERRSGTERPGN